MKKESPRHRANATTAIKITTVKPKKVATAAKPTVATPRKTEPVGRKSKLPDHHGTRGHAVYTTLGNTRSCPEKRTDHNRWENGGSSNWSALRDVRSCSEKGTRPQSVADQRPQWRAEGPATDQPSETSDPVLKKAKIMVAAKMEDPTYAEFVDMKRAVKKFIGQSFEIICGHVKGKMKSGEATGERPFLYLVKEDEAFIVGGNPEFDGGDRISRPVHQREFALTNLSTKELYCPLLRRLTSAETGGPTRWRFLA